MWSAGAPVPRVAVAITSHPPRLYILYAHPSLWLALGDNTPGEGVKHHEGGQIHLVDIDLHLHHRDEIIIIMRASP